MKHRLVIAALIALVLGAYGAVSAQSAVDPALLTVITQAFDQTRASTSLHIETQQLVAVQNADFSMQTQSSASWSLAAAAASWNLSGSQTTLMQFGDTPTESTVEYIVIDGVTYMNLDGAQMGGGFAPGGAQDQTTQTQPQGWFEVSAAASTENLAAQAFGALMFPVTAESITELPGDMIDGQAMRVLQISVSAQAVIDSDASVLLRTSGVGGFPDGVPPSGDGVLPADAQGTPMAPPSGDQGQPPTDAQRQPPTGDQTLDAANVRITFAVYIGQDDGLVHRIYSVIEIVTNRQDDSQAVTTTTSIHDYSAFNQPVEITAPAL